MTAAICIQCGADKFGALTPCPNCEFTPHSDTDQAKSILLSDHFLSRAELRTKSKLIRDGESITFPDAQISAITDASCDNQIDLKSDIFFTRFAVLMTLWVIGAILILIYIDIRWLKAVTGGLLFVTVFPTIVLWADILGPLRRTCRSCNRRGVTQGKTKVFDSTENYDKWHYCRNCCAVYLHVDGQWVPQGESENPSESGKGHRRR
jgi:hypothetical protein